MFSQFRTHYPQGSLISELVNVEYGKYVVRVLALVEGATLATSLAAAETVEQAEDNARHRLFELLGLVASGPTSAPPQPLQNSTTVEVSEVVPEPELPQEDVAIAQSRIGDERREADPFGIAPSFPAEEKSPLQPSPSSLPPEEVSSSEVELSPVEEPVLETYSPEEPREEEEIATPSVPDSPAKPALPMDFDFSDTIVQTNREIKRLGWTQEQGRKHLLETYGKRSRQLLTDEELVEFLDYLKSQPVPQ